mmetsp:Transcript_10296/g.17233  ORF Transcript_10296/g.17233 Transcript_10296/m.17233 type:complete len:568 (-) Transcript_10296:1820-3523(-)
MLSSRRSFWYLIVTSLNLNQALVKTIGANTMRMSARKFQKFVNGRHEDFKEESINLQRVQELQQHAQSIEQTRQAVLDSDAEVILIGESSHGTHEFYHWRAQTTKALIEQDLCKGVLIEGDFPDTADLHRYVCHMKKEEQSTSTTPLEDIFKGFERFPSWMWANHDMKRFVKWLRDYNKDKVENETCGIFGLDLYSLELSMQRVVEYLEKVDKECAEMVRNDYSCFGDLDPQTYGVLAQRGMIRGCHNAAKHGLNLVVERGAQHSQEILKLKHDQGAPKSPVAAADETFFTEMNACVVLGAEKYYKGMFDTNINTWNIRDQHFYDSLQLIRAHLRTSRGGNDRVVVWAHNSHVGDARYTHLEQPAGKRDLNIGQLCRQNIPKCLLVGQFMYDGRVTAASEWGAAHQYMQVRPSLPNSLGDLLKSVATPLHPRTFESLSAASTSASDGAHEKSPTKTGASMDNQKRFGLDLRTPAVRKLLAVEHRQERSSSPEDRQPHYQQRQHQRFRLQRAIGVIYRPETERWSHYYTCDVANQFDILTFFSHTRPVRPLVEIEEQGNEMETYPSGL